MSRGFTLLELLVSIA
ncbi:prepilin-type N-terminal cleavage/methylation domain-containing protein, partial [Vibrio sinaloensis]